MLCGFCPLEVLVKNLWRFLCWAFRNSLHFLFCPPPNTNPVLRLSWFLTLLSEIALAFQGHLLQSSSRLGSHSWLWDGDKGQEVARESLRSTPVEGLQGSKNRQMWNWDAVPQRPQTTPQGVLGLGWPFRYRWDKGANDCSLDVGCLGRRHDLGSGSLNRVDGEDLFQQHSNLYGNKSFIPEGEPGWESSVHLGQSMDMTARHFDLSSFTELGRNIQSAIFIGLIQV